MNDALGHQLAVNDLVMFPVTGGQLLLGFIESFSLRNGWNNIQYETVTIKYVKIRVKYDYGQNVAADTRYTYKPTLLSKKITVQANQDNYYAHNRRMIKIEECMLAPDAHRVQVGGYAQNVTDEAKQVYMADALRKFEEARRKCQEKAIETA